MASSEYEPAAMESALSASPAAALVDVTADPDCRYSLYRGFKDSCTGSYVGGVVNLRGLDAGLPFELELVLVADAGMAEANMSRVHPNVLSCQLPRHNKKKPRAPDLSDFKLVLRSEGRGRLEVVGWDVDEDKSSAALDVKQKCIKLKELHLKVRTPKQSCGGGGSGVAAVTAAAMIKKKLEEGAHVRMAGGDMALEEEAVSLADKFKQALEIHRVNLLVNVVTCSPDPSLSPASSSQAICAQPILDLSSFSNPLDLDWEEGEAFKTCVRGACRLVLKFRHEQQNTLRGDRTNETVKLWILRQEDSVSVASFPMTCSGGRIGFVHLPAFEPGVLDPDACYAVRICREVTGCSSKRDYELLVSPCLRRGQDRAAREGDVGLAGVLAGYRCLCEVNPPPHMTHDQQADQQATSGVIRAAGGRCSLAAAEPSSSSSSSTPGSAAKRPRNSDGENAASAVHLAPRYNNDSGLSSSSRPASTAGSDVGVVVVRTEEETFAMQLEDRLVSSQAYAAACDVFASDTTERQQPPQWPQQQQQQQHPQPFDQCQHQPLQLSPPLFASAGGNNLDNLDFNPAHDPMWPTPLDNTDAVQPQQEQQQQQQHWMEPQQQLPTLTAEDLQRALAPVSPWQVPQSQQQQPQQPLQPPELTWNFGGDQTQARATLAPAAPATPVAAPIHSSERIQTAPAASAPTSTWDVAAEGNVTMRPAAAEPTVYRETRSTFTHKAAKPRNLKKQRKSHGDLPDLGEVQMDGVAGGATFSLEDDLAKLNLADSDAESKKGSKKKTKKSSKENREESGACVII